MQLSRSIGWMSRAKAATVHLSASLIVATLSAALVFTAWYPWPYRVISGGTELFTLLVSVDVMAGPLLTFVVFDRHKRKAELRRDLGIVVILQLGALTYGLYATFLARPVVLALEVDRFRAVPAAAVVESELPQAPQPLRSLSINGPRTVATSQPADGDERFEAIAMGMAGVDLGMRPRYWREWDAYTRRAALTKARPLRTLLDHLPQRSTELRSALDATGRSVGTLVYLPLLARRDDWVVLLDGVTGEIVGFAPISGF